MCRLIASQRYARARTSVVTIALTCSVGITVCYCTLPFSSWNDAIHLPCSNVSGFVHKIRSALHGCFRVSIYPLASTHLSSLFPPLPSAPLITLENPNFQCILAVVVQESFPPPSHSTHPLCSMLLSL